MSVDLDTAILRAFLAAVRSGSLSRAARLDGRTQPALSLQLRRLETLSGRRLLERTRTGVALTPAGRAFVPIAERILALVDSIRAPAGDGHVEGTCRIGIAEDVANADLIATLETMRDGRTSLEIELIIDGTEQLLRQMRAAKLDLTLGDPAQFKVKPRRSRTRQLVWIASPQFDARAHPLPLVLYRAPCQWSGHVLSTLASAGVSTQVAFQSGSVASIIAACRASVGIAASLRDEVPNGCRVISPSSALPPAPAISLALYRDRRSRGFASVNFVECWIQRHIF